MSIQITKNYAQPLNILRFHLGLFLNIFRFRRHHSFLLRQSEQSRYMSDTRDLMAVL